MNPQWLPEAALFVAGVLAGIGALRLLATEQRSQALRMGAVSLTLLILSFVLVRSEMMRADRGRSSPPDFLLPASADSSSAATQSDTTPSTSLLLGDVTLRVAPSEQYVLSADGKRFLTLDVRGGRMSVTCQLAAPNDRPGVRIRQNRFQYSPGGTMERREPDRHTLLVLNGSGEESLNVLYAGPREIRVTGRFYLASLPEPIVISPKEGIRWNGGGVPPGTRIDLAHYGKGRIDFARSGLIQVVPWRGR